MTETLDLQREDSVTPNLPNKPDFIQEVDTFLQEGNKITSETIGILNPIKITMCLSGLLYWGQK